MKATTPTVRSMRPAVCSSMSVRCSPPSVTRWWSSAAGCRTSFFLPRIPEHVGSIDVDLALDAAKLGDGRYAELLKLLLDTGRYDKGDKDFQLVTTVDLGDGEVPVTG